MVTQSTEYDKKHKVRIMFGNGLRATLWKDFITRFNIPNIAEFYGATEGNANVINIENKIGSCGYIPTCVPVSLFPLHVIKIDTDNWEPVRGPDGLCVEAKPGKHHQFICLLQMLKTF